MSLWFIMSVSSGCFNFLSIFFFFYRRTLYMGLLTSELGGSESTMASSQKITIPMQETGGPDIVPQQERAPQEAIYLPQSPQGATAAEPIYLEILPPRDPPMEIPSSVKRPWMTPLRKPKRTPPNLMVPPEPNLAPLIPPTGPLEHRGPCLETVAPRPPPPRMPIPQPPAQALQENDPLLNQLRHLQEQAFAQHRQSLKSTEKIILLLIFLIVCLIALVMLLLAIRPTSSS
ncbi:ALTO [Pumfec polyomavirus LSF128]|nr:ALTO [Pumfec polyomavirus LSF128]